MHGFIGIFVADLGRCPDTAELAALLPADEARRAAEFGSRRRAIQSAGGRILLRRGLTHLLGADAAAWPLATAADGALFLDCEEARALGVRVSLAHSGRFIAVAVSCGSYSALGIDIESPRQRDFFSLAEVTLNPDEHAYLASLPEAGRSNAFYQFWTLKEACSKALGKGIASFLTGPSFALEPVSRVLVANDSGISLDWVCRTFRVSGGAIAAVAYEPAPDTVSTVSWFRLCALDAPIEHFDPDAFS